LFSPKLFENNLGPQNLIVGEKGGGEQSFGKSTICSGDFWAEVSF
jgi:hypothetical protein